MRPAIIANVKIAVVDQDPLTREFIVNVMMYSVNRAITAFGQGRQLLDHLTAHEAPHLVMTDAHLPDQSGIDLLKAIKRKFPATIVIIMSADPADEARAAEHKADAFLAKPFSLQDLFDIVQTFVVDDI